ncbi:bacillus/clostridium ger spore germination protein [Lucifera butyrica]|uniref:Bacillus/clostridium ger spore germination protein n=1 Tax=Lucifera butyrica TaxID=1351585 RepID=A0A498R4M5_9FIRM|nr:spore germination protein [Lucifera butyrica]VBB06394.1 bacillus/clostridium ger spore germination protein [Lucifera butyrica]
MKRKCSCRQWQKISAAIPAANRDTALSRLKELQNLLSECSEISGEIGQVRDQLRQADAPPGEPFRFTTALAENEHFLQTVFQDCADVIYRSFLAGSRRALLVYVENMIDKELINRAVMNPLMTPEGQAEAVRSIDLPALLNRLVPSAALSVESSVQAVITAVMSGKALLMLDGINEAILVGVEKYVKRSVSEPITQEVVRGPHDAFTETIKDNIVLVRRRTRDADIKIKIIAVGRRTRTEVALIYDAYLVKPGLAEEVERRIRNIQVDKIINSAAVEEFIVDRPWSPFPQVQSIERPDALVAALYEGRVAILVDNTPYALVVPCTYNLIMQSAEDYTNPPLVASLVRLTRHFSAFVAIYLPAVYVAIVSFHPGMLPTTLAISIAELRSRTPFPSFLEAVLMELILEVFQEAVVRLPRQIAGAASIVGGFVIGNTIVQAGLVNPLLVVVIAATAIASYSMPSFTFSLALRSIRVPMLVLSSILGLYGVMLGILIVTIHMCSLRSFGESYVGGLLDIALIGDWKDSLVRVPVRQLPARPKQLGAQERRRIEE